MFRSRSAVRAALGCTLLAPAFLAFNQALAAPIAAPAAAPAPAAALHIEVSAAGNTITFKPSAGVTSVRVQIKGADGTLFYNSGWTTGFDAGLDSLTWQALDDKGALLPAGTYLTQVDVRGVDGTTKTESGSLQLEAAPASTTKDVAPRATITGGGTTNRIVLWTSSTTVGDSIITQTASNAITVAGIINAVTVNATNATGNALVGNSTNATALAGITKSGNGVLGVSDSSIGMRGVSGTGIGVRGDSNNGTTGVQGNSNAASNNGSVPVGVDGVANGATSIGVRGSSTSGIGISGSTGSTAGGTGGTTLTGATGVLGIATATSGGGFSAGVRGINNSTTALGVGVYGAHAGSGFGVYGSAPSGYGVYANSTSGTGVYASSSSGYGAYITSSSGTGVYGNSSGNYGVYGNSSTNNGVRGVSGNSYGVTGISTSNVGVYGLSNGSGSAGVYGTGYVGVQGNTNGTDTSQGIRGDNGNSNTTGYAGVFNGRVTITGDLVVGGNLAKKSGSFRIDDPTDPANKYLSHSFVESPDMMNIYNGNATTDAKGYVTIQLPKYFGALNRDFRYQLTTIGSFARAIVAQEVKNNSFVIRTDTPNVKVSWQVTGVRRDPWANDHRIPTQQLKTGAERGRYLYPAGYHKPESMSMDRLVDVPRVPQSAIKPVAAKSGLKLPPAATPMLKAPTVKNQPLQSVAAPHSAKVSPRVAQAPHTR